LILKYADISYLCGPLEKVLNNMSISDHFSLPYVGMKDGFHSYEFEAGNDFFAAFENSPVNEGTFRILVEVGKRAGLSDLTFKIEGQFAGTCDRCLADIQLPASGVYHLLVKVGNVVSEDDEVIYIKEDETTLYLAQVIYELICISLPLINKYDCESEIPKPCNELVLSKINTTSLPESTSKVGNIWGGLSGLNLDN